MKKLMKRELEVLSSVICKRVEEEKKKVLEEKLKKNKEYLSLVKEGESIEKLVGELRKRGENVSERISMLNRKLGLGGDKGCVSWRGFSSYGINKVSCRMGYINRRDIEDKLIMRNLEGVINVEEIVKEIIKELV